MRPYSQKAAELRLCLRAGLIEPSEIIKWADQIIADSNEYDDDIANISLINPNSRKEIISLLGHIVDEADEWEALRGTMGIMHETLLVDQSRAKSFASFLESIWVENNYTVPDDMVFIVGIDDEFYLASEGIYGNVEEATSSLISNLSRYKLNTELED